MFYAASNDMVSCQMLTYYILPNHRSICIKRQTAKKRNATAVNWIRELAATSEQLWWNYEWFYITKTYQSGRASVGRHPSLYT